MKKALLGMAAGTALVGGLVVARAADAHTPIARATLYTAAQARVGTVEFKMKHTHTEVTVRLRNASGVDAFHGFHIHANDDSVNGDGCVADPNALSSTWFGSADGHFNPTASVHGDHVGDMPVLYVNSDGSVRSTFRIDVIKPEDIKGKVVIFHAGPDNFNNIPIGPGLKEYTPGAEAVAATAKTGNAGDRVACGLIKGG